MTLEAVLDLGVIAMLIAMCAYSVALNRRLGKLRTGHSDLKKAIETFDGAAERIDAALSRVDGPSQDAMRGATRAREDAQALLNELSVMVAAGSRVADRLESALADVKAVGNRGLSRSDKEAA